MADEQTVKQDEQTPKEEVPQLTVNIVSVEDTGTLKKKIKLEVPREEIDKRMTENYGELAKTAQVPGFRVGRAPRRLIEKRFSRDVREQVRLNLIGSAIERAIEESKLETLGEPDFKLEDIVLPEQGPLAFEFEVEIQPEFDLPTLEGIEVTETEAQVTDKDIDEQIENYRWQVANLQEVPAGGLTEKNDHIEADTKFEVGAEPPAVKYDTPLDLRGQAMEGVMLNDLGDQLAGLKIGDTKTIEATVPDTHANENWRGKTAKLTVTVKKLFRWILPELNDDLAKRFEFANIAEWRDTTRTELEARKGQQVRRDMETQIRKHLLDNVKIDVPAGLAERQTSRVLARRILDLQQMGIPPVLIEQKLEDLRTHARGQAVDDLKLLFVFDRIARQYEIEISEEEINGIIASIAGRSGRRPERVREDMMREGMYDNIRDMTRERKVIEKLLEKAKIVKGKAKKDDK
ncbi:MAG: trigger factor [Phycisphaerae bacterium]